MTELIERGHYVKIAAWIAICGNGVLAILKIVIGIRSGSIAVIGDGIDTATDIVASIVTLFAAVIMVKPPDKDHPYGHLRAEAIATKVVAFVIFFAGAQLALSAIRKLMGVEVISLPSTPAIHITVVSILGKSILALTQLRLGKRHQSPMIIANGKNMINDIFTSAGVLIGLGFIYLLNLPVLDSILAIVISLWIIKTAISIFLESSVEVMESVHDSSIYDSIFDAVDSIASASNPHRTRIRQIGHLYVIDLDIEVDGVLSVSSGHEIATSVEERIKGSVDNVYDIIVHVEPKGNREDGEKYGRTKGD